MANQTLKIKYTSESERSEWSTLADVQGVYSEAEIVEMVGRYLDAQKHAITYRKKAQAKAKLMKLRLEMLEAKAAEMGLLGDEAAEGEAESDESDEDDGGI